jgi:hypothetical protein
MKEELTHKTLKELLTYNTATGVFIWNHRHLDYFKSHRLFKTFNTRFSGTKAGSIDKKGYILICIFGKLYSAHRLAWMYIHGSFPIDQIDHINSITDDNRICNLREANKSQNGQNQKKAHKYNSSGLLGVSFYKPLSKYRAQIRLKGKQKHIGYFNTPEEAHTAYIQAKRKYHEFGTL